MKILSVAQIREWDQYTIQHEPIRSVALMERAANAWVRWFCQRYDNQTSVAIFCGMGNNGGDGLAIARILLQKFYNVKVFVVKHIEKGSSDFEENLVRLSPLLTIHYINQASDLPATLSETVIVDALLGSGLSRPAEGIMAEIITFINDHSKHTICIDIASGLFADRLNSPQDLIIKPNITVSFQSPKLAFFQPQCANYVGEWHLVDIGLHPSWVSQAATPYYCTQSEEIRSIVKKRPKYSHKGTYGHSLLIGGSYGKMGAMVLSAKACLRAGVGLLTVQVPRCGYDILQISVPEAMVQPDWHWNFNTQVFELSAYTAIGIGPGLGKDSHTLTMLRDLLRQVSVPMVLDADALNLLAESPENLTLLPPNTVLTPHPKEFQRLVGKEWRDDYEKLHFLRTFAQQHRVIVCLKGAHTAVALPDGSVHFNTTGNPGMATAGSGDVLTGIITGLLSQGYSPAEAAIFGVFQHGKAGDRAAQKCTQPALIASDIINEMGW